MGAGNSFNTVKSKTSEGKNTMNFCPRPSVGGGEVASNASWNRSPGRGTPSSKHQNWGPTSLLVTSGGDHWKPVQICSFGELPPHKHIWR